MAKSSEQVRHEKDTSLLKGPKSGAKASNARPFTGNIVQYIQPNNIYVINGYI